MGFRDRLHKVISRHSVSERSNSTSGSSSSTITSSSSRSTRDDPSRYINGDPKHMLYGPDEVIPYKYKRPVNKDHKAKLDAYNFAKAWSRKNSATSVGLYSPMGSRLPSRRGSFEAPVGRRGREMMVDPADLPRPPKDHTAADAMAASMAHGDTVGQDFAPKGDSPFTMDELTKALTKNVSR